SRMRSIVGSLEGSLVSALEAVVLTRADSHVERFARHILQTATAQPVESRSPQRLPVTAAMTDAQTTVLPKLAGRAEAAGRVNVSAEATGADRPDTRRRAQQLNLRQSLGQPQHQQFRFRL